MLQIVKSTKRLSTGSCSNQYRCGIACSLLALLMMRLAHGSEAVVDVGVNRIAAQQAESHKADPDMTLDGRLDEPAWLTASDVSQFFEIYPKDGEITHIRTEVRFLYDNQNVYVGIRAYDPNSDAIRSSLVRRDQVLSDQDYVELLLDPLNSRRSAMIFRSNAKGVITDGQFNEDTQFRDYSVDLNFNVKALVDDKGWIAEFRIPLATLRYQSGASQSWAFVVFRNRPRDKTFQFASAPIPRATNCVLCFAAELTGISTRSDRDPLTVTPYMTYLHRAADGRRPNSRSNLGRVGGDVKWQPRADTAVDLTLSPDFSQIEADDLQLTVNTRFALAVPEKRPFFLESSDLLSTPVNAVYTRAFAAPDGGIRITRRGTDHEYVALLLRDGGGGSIIEPGAITSSMGLQESDSTAFVGRYKFNGNYGGWSAMVTGRLNDDGSENLVSAVDATWSPSSYGRFTAQVLSSQTQNPNRPALLPSWSGQEYFGHGGIFSWGHSSNAWHANFAYELYSKGFRAWNGFVPQVGVSTMTAGVGINFYPNSGSVIRIAPTINATTVEAANGDHLGGYIAPNLLIEAAHDTSLSLTWYPHKSETGVAGLRSYSFFSANLTSTPLRSMPQITLSASFGEDLNSLTGGIGRSTTVQAAVPLRLFERLELVTSVARQSLDSPSVDGLSRSITQFHSQVNGRWYFSNRLYAEALLQQSRLVGTTRSAMHSTEMRSSYALLSILLSYQSDWQTRYFIGFRSDSDRSGGSAVSAIDNAEVFVKLSYVLGK